MDGVTVISGLIAVSVLAVVVLWFTRNKGVVGKRVVVGESTPKITSLAKDGAGDADPADDWEIIPVTRTRRMRGQKPAGDGRFRHPASHGTGTSMCGESVAEPLSEPLFAPDRMPKCGERSLTASLPPATLVLPCTSQDAQEPPSLRTDASPAQEEITYTAAEPPAVDKLPDTPRELIVVLNIIASQEQWLDGPRVVNAVRSVGMQYSDSGIFHYVSTAHPQDEPLFSLANMLNPGIFKMDEIEQLTTPGVTLFMRLSDTTAATLDGLDAFARMHDTARQLARTLNADVYDERRLMLTEKVVLQLREKIIQHQRSSVVH